jgi:methylamine dehydrogenase accessory protein MauD
VPHALPGRRWPAVPAGRGRAALALLTPLRGRRRALGAAAAAGYGAVMAWHRAHGHRLDCGCGGEPLPLSWAWWLRNALLAALARPWPVRRWGRRALALGDFLVIGAAALVLAPAVRRAAPDAAPPGGPRSHRTFAGVDAMDTLTVSVVLLWLAVIVLGLMLWALSRQVGVLFERVAPMGALVTDAGPAVGEPHRVFSLRGIQSEAVLIGGAAERPTLVFFLSPTCPVCKKLIPVLKALQRDERRQLRWCWPATAKQPSTCASCNEQGLQAMPYVLSTELGMGYRVSRLPYAVLLDTQGTVAAKGLVNSREQLDSLLNAHDMGTPTIQQYLGARPPEPREP